MTSKQIIQMQHKMIDKPQLAGGNQMAIYNRGRGFELGTTESKSSKWPEQDSNPGPPKYEPDALTTRPRCLPHIQTISPDTLMNLFGYFAFA